MTGTPRWSRAHEQQARAILDGTLSASPEQVRALLWACMEELDRVRCTVMARRRP